MEVALPCVEDVRNKTRLRQELEEYRMGCSSTVPLVFGIL